MKSLNVIAKKRIITLRHRDVAQLGSALPWGGRGRQFKSDRSDHLIIIGNIVTYFYLPKHL